MQRIAVTAGEPAGIGPDLIAELASCDHDCEIVVVGDADLLSDRAKRLGKPLTAIPYNPDDSVSRTRTGTITVEHIPLAADATPGQLNPDNASYVLNTLERAGRGCLENEFAAVLTAPVQKSVICESGTAFSGHTEYFAQLCGAALPVMLLCADRLRVALLTTHMPLSDVPAQITRDRVSRTCRILHRDLQRLFGIEQPRIAVLGLNPHAGEAGQLGLEEQEQIIPAMKQLQAAGLNLDGPLPADSAFTQQSLNDFDAVLAMYHDQGLPVLKHAGFGKAVNVTLGLPIVRTSVDHGTALTLAGSDAADPGSMQAALQLACEITARYAA